MMYQTVITYDKATLRVISAVQVNAFISEANILKQKGYEVLITAKDNAIYLDERDHMYLKRECIKK